VALARKIAAKDFLNKRSILAAVIAPGSRMGRSRPDRDRILRETLTSARLVYNIELLFRYVARGHPLRGGCAAHPDVS
jgi:hypothetical protein